MGTVSVTTKGQVTIPKRVRQALGITAGSKVEFDVDGSVARLKLIKKQRPSSIEEGRMILSYRGPRIPIEQMHGGVAIKRTTRRAGR